VLPAIQFEGEFGFRTVEIQDVGSERMLPAKLVSGKASIPQQAPQAPLRLRHLLPQRSSPTVFLTLLHAGQDGWAGTPVQEMIERLA